jgi:MFS transporter, DHA1 family, multidrug resistance protein
MPVKILLFITLFVMTLADFGVDLYTPSLPAITHALSTTPALVKMTISIYLFGFALGQIIFGTLSDIYGRKKILLIGLGVFVVTSIAAIFVQNIYLLIILRLIQGFSAAATSVIPKALLTDTLTGKPLAVAMSYLVVVWALSPIIAPVIGGYIQYYFNWHGNFYFYALYSGLMLITVLCFLKETNTRLIKFNLPNVVNQYKQVFRSKVFVAGMILLGCSYTLVMIFNITGPFLIQNNLGYSSIVFGRTALLIGAAYFIGSLGNRFLINRYSSQRVTQIGLVMLLLSSLSLLYLAYTVHLNLLIIILPIFGMVLALGFINPNCMTQCLSLFPEKGGTASALLGFSFTTCAALSSFVVSLIKHGGLVSVAWAYLFFVVVQLLLYKLFLANKAK